MTGLHPEGTGMSDAISAAMARARVDAEGIGYINAHGSGTKQDDLLLRARRDRSFSPARPPTPGHPHPRAIARMINCPRLAAGSPRSDGVDGCGGVAFGVSPNMEPGPQPYVRPPHTQHDLDPHEVAGSMRVAVSRLRKQIIEAFSLHIAATTDQCARTNPQTSGKEGVSP